MRDESITFHPSSLIPHPFFMSLAIVILAAGKGTRMKSELAKVLHTLCDKPLVAWALETVLALQPDRTLVVVGHQAEAVEAAVNASFPNIEFVLQSEMLGTGDAVRRAAPALQNFEGDVIVTCGDVPLLTTETLRRLIQTRRDNDSAASMLVAQIPDLSATLDSVVSQPCWAVLAAFEERVPARFDGAFVHGSPLGWVARNQSKPKREWKVDTWVLHATATWSRMHLDDDPEVVGSVLMEAFHDLIPNGLPRAFYATAHRWRYASADPPLAVGAIHHGKITLCGDWCLGNRIEDAFLSGLQAAKETE